VRYHRGLIRAALVLGIAVVAVAATWHGTIRTLPAQAGPAQASPVNLGCQPPATVPAGIVGTSIAIYAAGWNLVAGNDMGFDGVSGPLYTYNPATGGYIVVQSGANLAPGKSAWAYFPCPTGRNFCVCAPLINSIPITAGQYAMIGNPGFGTINLTGVADAVIYTYDPVSGAYQQTTKLGPGQGAWAYSSAGGTLQFR
jgi:hypothetical protein